MSDSIFIEEVAKICGVSVQTIHNWKSQKPDFPRGVRIGRKVEWEREAIIAWRDAVFGTVRKDNAERLELLTGATKKKAR